MASYEKATMTLATLGSVSNNTQTSPSVDELITQLFDTVNGLRESASELRNQNTSLKGSVAQLQEENSNLRKDLMTLQQNSGVRFSLFPKLPLELRRHIWQLACRVGQVHIVSDKSVSQSQVSAVINSCREAKEAADTVKLDYFLFSTCTHYPEAQVVQGTVRHYFNADLDTLWFVRKGEEVSTFTEDIQWVCGKCDKIGWPRYPHRACGEECFFSSRSGDEPAYFQSVAINIHDYIRPGDDDIFDMGSLDLIWRSNVKEILLVVEYYGCFEMERDVVFVPPAERPWPTLRKKPANGLIVSINEDIDLRSGTWKMLEEWMVEEMEIFKEQQEEDREEAVESGESMWADLDDESHLRDLSDWNIPKVRFVEARKRNGPWTLRPKEKTKQGTT